MLFFVDSTTLPQELDTSIYDENTEKIVQGTSFYHPTWNYLLQCFCKFKVLFPVPIICCCVVLSALKKIKCIV